MLLFYITKYYKILFLFLLSFIEIAPEPISNTKPTVRIIKKIKPIVNPKVLIWYKDKAIGNKSKISKSKTRNN